MNAYDLYTFYIEPEDLRGQAVKVKIIAADVKDTFNPRTKAKEKQIVLRFAGKQKVLGLNKTRAGSMIEITGTPESDAWVGTEIVIKPGKQSGKDTVVIEAAKTAPAARGAGQTRLDELKAKAPADIILAYSELWKAAGLQNEDAQAVLRECGGDMDAAFGKIANAYAVVIG